MCGGHSVCSGKACRRKVTFKLRPEEREGVKLTKNRLVCSSQSQCAEGKEVGT